MSQIHKRFTTDAVKELFERYLKKEIERKYLQEILEIKKSRFFMLLSRYGENPKSFAIQYRRTAPSRFSPQTEHNILKELSIQKEIIQNIEIPLKSYNYSYIKDRLRTDYHQKVSLPTIIDRAKKKGFTSRNPKGPS
jgi:hypothetical protein